MQLLLQQKEMTSSIAMPIWILGIHPLLFHAPFIGLGLSSLPFQATITIGMYVSVIIVLITGISLAIYEYLLSEWCCTPTVILIGVATFLTAAMIIMLSVVDILVSKSERRCTRTSILIINATFLTALLIIMLSVVDIMITHYFHSTADISQAEPSQFFNSLVSFIITTAFSVTMKWNFLYLCKIIKGWMDKE